MALPKIKKDGPNAGLWGTKEQIASAWREALAFGPVQTMTAKAIRSGGPFPGTYRGWDGLPWKRK